MGKRCLMRAVLAFAAVSAFCILFGAGPAFAVDIPEKLRNIPLYQGSTVLQSMDMGNSSMLVASVKGTGAAITDFYKKAMTEKGWKMYFQAEQDDAKVIQFQKDRMMLHVSVQLEKGAETAKYQLMLMTSP